MHNISEKTVERLSLYRRVLLPLRDAEEKIVFSHQLSDAAGVTAAQVRRDIMQLGCSGIPRTGYRIVDLLEGINAVLDAPEGQRAVLVGVGHLGLALLTHFSGRWRWLHIHAAFDTDPVKVGTVIRGCHCYPLFELPQTVRERRADIGVITVPKDAAQAVAERLFMAGIRSILNFAPVRLRVPSEVYVEHVDLTTLFEKVAYFARHPLDSAGMKETRRRAGSSLGQARARE